MAVNRHLAESVAKKGSEVVPLRLLLALILVAAAPMARANEACNLAGRLVHIEALSQQVSAVGNAQAATRTIDSMMALINQTPPQSARLIAEQLGRYALAQFLESRAHMAYVFRSEGLAAAQQLVNQQGYRALAEDILRLGGLLGCDDAAAGGKDTPQSPLTTSGRPSASPIRQMTGVTVIGTTSLSRIEASLAILAGLALVATLAMLLHQVMTRHRRDMRYLCDLPVKLATGGETMEARLIDISARGAKLMIRRDLPKKQAGTVYLGNFGATPFYVVWSNEHYAGIRFRTPLEFSLSVFLKEFTAFHA